MSFDSFYRIARGIRNLPVLRDHKNLWRIVHRPYYALMRATGWSVNYSLTPDFTFKIPVYFLRQDWRTYEPDGTASFIAWFRKPTKKPRIVLDIGCSVGFYSAVALFADPDVRIYAFDADVESLRLVPLFCSKASHPEHAHLIWGFLASDASQPALSMDDAEAATHAQRQKIKEQPRLERIAYKSLVEKSSLPTTPVYTVDALTQEGRMFDDCTVLFKCDVEGAELHVLRGARKLIKRLRPTLMLSVHPPAWLAQHNSTREQIEAFLREEGYEWKVFPCDHEEHWLAAPIDSASTS